MMKFFKNENGQGVVEFSLIVGLVAVAVMIALNVFSAGINGLFGRITDQDALTGNVIYMITTEDGVYVVSSLGWMQGPYTGSASDIAIPYSLNGYTVKAVYQDVFNGKGLTSVDFGSDSDILRIHSRAFNNNQLTSIVLPANLQRIDLWAFRDNKLTEITLPSSMQTIEQKAFSGNNITKITIGSNVSNIGTGVFDNDNEGFKAAYATGGAGTYVYSDGHWTKQ